MDTTPDNLDTGTAPKGQSVLLAMSWYDHRTHLGISRFAKKHGWRVDARMANSTEMAWGWKGDGVITKIGCSAIDDDLYTFISKLDCPTIDLSVFGPDLGYPAIEFDPKQIGALAADHFIERGFTHFAWFPEIDSLPAQTRRDGFIDAIASRCESQVHRIPLPNSESKVTDWEADEQELGARLNQLPKPVAVMCFNDEWGSRIIRACEAAGLQIPEDVAVLGVDDNQLICEHLPITLSSVQLDLEYWGTVAAQRLAELMAKDDLPEKSPATIEFIAPRGISVRQSTDVISVEHPDVLAAAKFIADQYHRPINATDVIEQSRLSASGLKQAFRKSLGRTINDEIRRVRYERTRKLLTETDWTLERIAEDVGLNDTRTLHRLFKHFRDETPTEYRKRFMHESSG